MTSAAKSSQSALANNPYLPLFTKYSWDKSSEFSVLDYKSKVLRVLLWTGDTPINMEGHFKLRLRSLFKSENDNIFYIIDPKDQIKLQCFPFCKSGMFSLNGRSLKITATVPLTWLRRRLTSSPFNMITEKVNEQSL